MPPPDYQQYKKRKPTEDTNQNQGCGHAGHHPIMVATKTIEMPFVSVIWD
jgi:hypothetical protein